MCLGDTPRYTVYEFFLQITSSSAVRTLHRSSAFGPRSPRRRIIWGHPLQPHTQPTNGLSALIISDRAIPHRPVCLCSTSIFFWAYRYLLGLTCKIPPRPRAFLARTYSQTTPDLPVEKGWAIPQVVLPIRSIVASCLLACFCFFITNPCVLPGRSGDTSCS